MSIQEENACGIEVSNGEQPDEAWVINSIVNASPPSSSTTRIHRVPTMVRETKDYKKYYVPKVVSIGPYHFRNRRLEFVEKLKPVFTMKLLSNNKETLRRLYKALGEAKMVQELRNFYEEKSTNKFCDKVFTRMMLLDGCFILYYMQSIFGFENCPELKRHQIVFVHQDLFLLENQIPSKVLNEVMELVKFDWREKIIPFINDNILASGRRKRGWFCGGIGLTRNDQSSREKSKGDFHVKYDHLLQLLQCSLTQNKGTVPKTVKTQNEDFYLTSNWCTFRNVNELIDVGICFKPSKVMSLAHVEFFGRWWWFSADVKLPPITVHGSTKPMLLNLIAYEMCSDDVHDAWVTAYICLLDSLIDHPEDVKALRKARVLYSLESDIEVAKLFNEIGTDLVAKKRLFGS